MSTEEATTPWFILQQDYINRVPAEKAHANLIKAGFNVQFSTVEEQYEEWTMLDMYGEELLDDDMNGTYFDD